MTSKKNVHIIVTIVERSQGGRMVKLYNENKVELHYQLSGVGTASSDLLDMLGFGSSERDILLSFASAENARSLLYDLNEELRSSVRCKGIVFNMPLTGLNNTIVNMLLNMEQSEEREADNVMEHSGKHSLILIVVNQGNTDVVMHTAKEFGARGGTILRSRWVGTEHMEQHFYGIALQEEKEVIAIVAASENRNGIMEHIIERHGPATEAGAMICSVGIENTIMLG